MSSLKKALSAEPAQWIIEQIHPFGQDVGSIVPEGFESYARVFHPAWRGGPDGTTVRWAEIAASMGTVFHVGAQWPHIAFPEGIDDSNDLQDPPPGAPWDSAPEEGSLDLDVAQRLVSLLGEHTSTPGKCWFAFWDGWGIPSPLYPAELSSQKQPAEKEEEDKLKRRWDAPAFELPARRYLLFEGPVEGARESFYGDAFMYQSASLWWPEDHAWCVATEVDFESTYIGGSRRGIDAILADDFLEALETNVGYGIGWNSDTINPNPLPY